MAAGEEPLDPCCNDMAAALSFETGRHFFVEDGVGSGVFVNSGHLEKLSNSKGRYRRDCKQGQMLPGGAMMLIDLAGRRLEVRDGADTVYLSTTIPNID